MKSLQLSKKNQPAPGFLPGVFNINIMDKELKVKLKDRPLKYKDYLTETVKIVRGDIEFTITSHYSGGIEVRKTDRSEDDDSTINISPSVSNVVVIK